ncbi:MAG: hypothetical protein HKP54_11620 [Boseongicola sp.]|nr:hypothetical protein [Boseongicola sp.]
MRISHTFLASSGLLALAACGGGGGAVGGFGGNASGVINGYAPVYATAPDDIDPTDEMDESVEGGPGATGIMAVATSFDASPEFASVKVRTNNDGSILYLSINGGSEVALDEIPGGAYGSNPPMSEPLVSYIGVFNSAWFQYTKINGASFDSGDGVIGIETPTIRLPTGGPVNYTGDVTLFSYNDTLKRDDIVGVNGTFDMNVDFDTQSITGTTGGDINISVNGGGLNSYAATGTVSGSTDGNGLIGSMTFDSAGGNASLTFAGKTYGWNADEIGGALIGSISGTGAGALPIYGHFDSD